MVELLDASIRGISTEALLQGKKDPRTEAN